MFLVVLLQILFALSFIIFRKTVGFGSPFFLVGIRMVIAGLLLLSYQYLVDKKSFSKLFANLKNTLNLLVLASILNVYITNSYEFWGIQYISAAKASLIYNFSPFISAFLSYIFLNEIITRKKGLGIIIGMFGFLPVLINNSPAEKSMAHFGFLSLAELALLAAAIATAYGWIIIKQLVYQKHVPIVLVNGITMFFGGLMALGHSVFIETWPNIFAPSFISFWGYTFLVIFIAYISAYNLYASLLSKYSPTFLSFAGFITPFPTAFFGWIFLGETVPWSFYLSMFIVFIGLYIFYQDEIKQTI